MADENLNLPVTLSLSSTKDRSETTINPNNTVVTEVIEIDASSDAQVKRPRGRPRKYEVGGNKPSRSGSPELAIQPFGSEVKRRRGRPRGSGKLQILASIGGCVTKTVGGSMTPHMLTVNSGEDVVEKIFTFFHNGFRGTICILSAVGSVSSVILRQPGVSGGSLRYEGVFQILSLSGSCTFTSGGGAERKIDMLSVSLSKLDGGVFGGGIERSLIAATPIQLILATFKQNISNQIKRKYSSPPSTTPNMVTNQDSSSDNKLKVLRLTLEGEPSCLRETTTTTKSNGVAVTNDNVKVETTTNVEFDFVGDGVIDLDSQTTLELVNANSVP